MVGMAYHAGALRALEEEGGFRPADADLIVGTSAGSVLGAYLRSGWSTRDFWELAMGTHEALGSLSEMGQDTEAAPLLAALPRAFAPAFHTPLDLARRFLGSAYVMTRSVVRVPTPVMPGFLGHAFPAGLFSMGQGRRRLAAELPDQWPESPLWLCAVDIVSGERIVLGSRGAPSLSLADAVAASCAIPGVYAPVRLGRRVLVDGGVHSTTNLDLAVGAQCDVAICVAPMAFDRHDPPDPLAQLVRRVPTRALAIESNGARRRGVRVLSVRPSASEVRLHGLRMMRVEGLDEVARAAYESTARAVTSGAFRQVLGPLAV
jgi:NTE family protein